MSPEGQLGEEGARSPVGWRIPRDPFQHATPASVPPEDLVTVSGPERRPAMMG